MTKEARRHPVTRFWPVVSGLAAIVAISTAGTVYALWVANASTGPLTARQAVVGFAVTKDGTVAASLDGQAVGFTIGQTEAQALVDDGPDMTGTFSVSIPFDVTMASSAGYGFSYTLTSDLDGSGVLGFNGAEPSFVKVDSPAQCTATPVGDAYSSGQAVNGLVPGAKDQQTATDHWCMVISVTSDVYKNVATAAGTNAVGDDIASLPTSWMAYLLPDPGAQSSVPVTVTPTPIWECEP